MLHREYHFELFIGMYKCCKGVSCFRAILSIAKLTVSPALSDLRVMCNNFRFQTKQCNTQADLFIYLRPVNHYSQNHFFVCNLKVDLINGDY